jgi:hypothetical protein
VPFEVATPKRRSHSVANRRSNSRISSPIDEIQPLCTQRVTRSISAAPIHGS